MGVIVCQTCGKVIDHFEAEKYLRLRKVLRRL
ncbi:GapA-binding peptide SR1P [Anaerobacillus sp. HL2]|nr:GapA-binding peptide SR1P [Anaerobacillus sp. HL2]